MIPVVPRPQRVGLTRQCVHSIQEYVASHNVHPGDKLPSQQEWAEMLGVSVLVVREALRALQTTGLVDIQHGRGVFLRGVEQIDFVDFLLITRSMQALTLNEITEARAMLEVAVLECCIARATGEDIADLDAILRQMRENAPALGVDPPGHREFHRIMLRASGNRLLMGIGMPLMNTFWALGKEELTQLTENALNFDALALHTAYLEAIRNRDLSHVHELVDEHLMGLCSKHRLFPFIVTPPS